MTLRSAIYIVYLAIAATMFSCGNAVRKKNAQLESVVSSSGTVPAQYTYRVINTYPHSSAAYTQGLFWHEGVLYESSGLYGKSYIGKSDLHTGKTELRHTLHPRYFAEGAVILDNKIYLLTWREGVCFVLDAQTLKLLEEFRYSGEGWGITTDGLRLYMSDGSSVIKVLDPATFRVERLINVSAGTNRLSMINELEWVEGEIWANVYMSDFVVRIDPVSGSVTGVVDMTGILPKADIKADTDVLNGIAYDSLGGRIFVTGKNWNSLFEIQVLPK